jgi:coenzyme F420-reducing hydrogenase delta subunit
MALYAGNEQEQPGPYLGSNAGASSPEPCPALSADCEAGAEQIAAFRRPASPLISDSIRQASHSTQQTLKTCIFYCSNNLDAEQFARLCRGSAGDTVKTISLPCSGKVDVPYLIKAFETGADGVVIVTCKKNECRHFEGSPRAHKRAEAVESLLEEIGMGAGHMAVVECEKGGVERVLGEIKRSIERVRSLPQGSARSGAVNAKESTVA